MIAVKVNDIQKEFPDTLTINELIDELSINTNGIAIAINENVVKRENWTSEFVKNNDNILIIKSTQGG